MWRASVAGGLVLSCLAFGLVMNSASLVAAVGAAAFGAVTGALLGAGIHLT
jgi:hypothetical protein